MECCLEIGCIYQICVYMVYIGYLLIGDDDYGLGFKIKINWFEDLLKLVVVGFKCQVLYVGLLVFEYFVMGIIMWFESFYFFDFVSLLFEL